LHDYGETLTTQRHWNKKFGTQHSICNRLRVHCLWRMSHTSCSTPTSDASRQSISHFICHSQTRTSSIYLRQNPSLARKITIPLTLQHITQAYFQTHQSINRFYPIYQPRQPTKAMISRSTTLGALALVSILAHNSIAGFQLVASSFPRSTLMQRNYVPSSTKRSELNMLEGAVGSFDTFYHTQPYLAAFLTCSVKASAADFLAQSKQKNNNIAQDENFVSEGGEQPSIDFFRNLSFVLYGGLYQGMGQCFIFTHLYPSLFGTVPTLTTVLAQASIDNFVLAPFFCLPTVYTLKSLLAGGTPQEGINKYKDHIVSQNVLLKYWAIWFPVQCLNFGVVPEHLRVPFCAVISFFWVCLLSSITAQEQASSDDKSSVAPTTDAATAPCSSFAFLRGQQSMPPPSMPPALATSILMWSCQPPTTTTSSKSGNNKVKVGV
jgi:hypothetical protein